MPLSGIAAAPSLGTAAPRAMQCARTTGPDTAERLHSGAGCAIAL